MRDVPRWRDSDRFSDIERQVLDYAERITRDPHTVDDAQVAALRSALGEAALVELTMRIAHENMRARFNSAMGRPPQGFSERCARAAA